jgi:lipoyl(octanoyl) transferase
MGVALGRPGFANTSIGPTLNAMNSSTAFQAKSFFRSDNLATGWAISPGLTDYGQALAAMESRAEAIARGEAEEIVWLLEHPSLYSAGISAKAEDLLTPERFPVVRAGRGGQFTYHGPGQRVAYVMLDLRARGRDARAYVAALERWLIEALADLGVTAETRCGRVGVWVEKFSPGSPPREEKIAAIGVKLRHWVSFHGVSLNVSPDLGHYAGIVPCGISDHGVTSLQDMGAAHEMAAVDAALEASFSRVFGSTVRQTPPTSP